MADMAMFDSLASSNMPTHHKSAMRRFAEKHLGKYAKYRPGLHHIERGTNAIRQGGTSLAAGGILGVVHAMRATGLDAAGGKLPLDAIGGTVALAASVALAHDPLVSCTLADAGGVAVGVFGFRKGHDLMVELRKKGTAIHGETDMGTDPVVAAAAAM